MPGASIRLRHDAGATGTGLVVAEGLLLTLTDPRSKKQHITRAADTARQLLSLDEADTTKVARALAEHIEKIRPAVQEAATMPSISVKKGGGQVGAATGAQGAQVRMETKSKAKPKTRGGVAGEVGAKGAPAASNPNFEKLHPRDRTGRWVKAGDGYDQPNPTVSQLQRRLAQLGYGPGAPDGKFGPLTQQALAKFQADYGLQGDGSHVDPATLQVLQNPPAQKLRQIQAEQQALANVPDANGKVAGATGGSTGGTGSSTSAGASGSATTTLDTTDPEAVKKFQQAHGLKPDGVVGPNTEALMKGLGVHPKGDYVNPDGTVTSVDHAAEERDNAKKDSSKSSSSSSGTGSASGSASGAASKGANSETLAPGDGLKEPSADVKALQQVLDALGYDLGESGIDGRYGSDTEKAIRKLQKRYGLKVDGVAGPRTMRLLKRLGEQAKKKAKDDDIKSGDEVTEAQIVAAVEKRKLAEAAGDVDAFIAARAAEVHLRENFIERLHPRDRLGKFADVPGGSKGSSFKYGPGDRVVIEPATRHYGDRVHPGRVHDRYVDKFGGRWYTVATGNGNEDVLEDQLRRPSEREGVKMDPGTGSKPKKSRIILTDEDRAFPETAMWPEAIAERRRAQGKRRFGMRSVLDRLTEAAEIRESATPGTPEHIEARAREVELARQVMEEGVLNAAARKASATVVRQKGGKTEYKFPIPDKAHAKAALAYLNSSDLTPEEKAKVRARAMAVLAEARRAEREAEMVAALDEAEVLMIAEAVDSLRKASTHKHGLESKKGPNDNWIERSSADGRGQLPAYIQHIALALVRKRGMPKSRAIAIAIGTVKRWARGGGDVDANTRAAAAKAVAEWEALKAKNKAKKVTEAWDSDLIDTVFECGLMEADTKADYDDMTCTAHGRKKCKSCLMEAVFEDRLHPRNRFGRFIHSFGGRRNGGGAMDGFVHNGKRERIDSRIGDGGSFEARTRRTQRYAEHMARVPETPQERGQREADERYQAALLGKRDPGTASPQAVQRVAYSAFTGEPAERRASFDAMDLMTNDQLNTLDDTNLITIHTATLPGGERGAYSSLHSRVAQILKGRDSDQASRYMRGLNIFESLTDAALALRESWTPTFEARPYVDALAEGVTDAVIVRALLSAMGQASGPDVAKVRRTLRAHLEG
jgi:peptidoglycan hydrolase-like protein with peptidoglycan-binding domain